MNRTAKAIAKQTAALIVTKATTVGKHRHHNEDFADHSKLFFAVADGVGGSPCGEIASATAVTEAIKVTNRMAASSATIEWVTDKAFEAAAGKLATFAGTAYDGMATTMVTLAVAHNYSHAIIGHVGDSRAYLIHEDKAALRITTDQSYRNVLHGVLSTDRATKQTLYDIQLRPGDMILLCTDGVTNEITDDRLVSLLHRYPSADTLIEYIDNRTAARDNATAILVRIP